MKRWGIAALGLSLLLATQSVAARDAAAVDVVRVVDGDVIDVQLADGAVERIRLIGINTPETTDPRLPLQCFGLEAAQRAHELLDGQVVALEVDAGQAERDRLGRRLGYVWLADGRNVAEVMIDEGFGFEYTYGAPYAYQDAFRAAQARAQSSGAGLWSGETCGGQRGPTDLDDDSVVQPDPMVPPLGYIGSEGRSSSLSAGALEGSSCSRRRLTLFNS